jgi:hypothetical protein
MAAGEYAGWPWVENHRGIHGGSRTDRWTGIPLVEKGRECGAVL